MKIKTFVTGILLLFVGISVIYLVTGETRSGQARDESPAEHDGAVAHDNAMVDSGPKKAKETNHRVIAYYFHGTQRCVTCRTIESYAEESLRAGFSDELAAGELEWRVVNVDTPENEHFIQDYELSTRSVVLVDMLAGEQKQWKNLSRVWELVRDKPAFAAYIQEETREFLGE